MNAVWRSALLLITLTWLCAGCSFSLGRNTCLKEVRGAFDIGSGTTKAVAVEVNTCNQPLATIVWEDSRVLALKEDLLKNGKLSADAHKKALEVLGELLQKLRQKGATHVSGVATMAAREAPNGAEFVKILGRKLNIPLRIISQKEEAALGAVSARTLRPEVTSDVIWDIGGASAQWIYKDQAQTEFILSDLASVSFKELVMKQTKHKGSTPNPLGKSGLEIAQKISRRHAKNFSPKLSRTISKGQGVVLGIGGVHRYSVLGNLQKRGFIPAGKQAYTREELAKAIKASYLLSDTQIGGEYASTDVTNLILVYSQMSTLGVSRVEVAKGNLALGVVMQEMLKSYGANDL